MGKRTKTEGKRRQNKVKKPSLRVVSAEFTPTPGAEQRLVKVYQLLLDHHIEESQATKGDEAISQKGLKD